MTPRLRHRRQRVDRRRARGAARERGDDVVALARSDAAAAKLAERGAEVVRGDTLDEDALAPAWRLRARLPRRRRQHALPDRPGALFHVNVRGAETAVRAAARAGVAARRAHLVGRDARRGARHVGTRGLAAPRLVPVVYERSKHEGEIAALAAARAPASSSCRQPVLGPGPGARRRHRPDPDRLPQRRLKVFVDTNISLVDIRDCVEGHLLAAERGRPASATCSTARR
jgi:dihydroflavonol-4-reductase